VKLYAVSDLHLHYPENRKALRELAPHPDDWLIVAGDVGHSVEHLDYAWEVLGRRFAKLFWVPGNHELWSPAREPGRAGGPPGRGVTRYEQLVAVCREHGVLTPEDPFEAWPGELPDGLGSCLVAPLFVLYDYSFRPKSVALEDAVAWAGEHEVLATDEALLHSDPYPSKADWCAARVEVTEKRLAEASARSPLVLVNHFPLKERHVTVPAIPRFRIWCGTRKTEDWPERFRAHAVVYGHLHVRTSRVEDGVRYDEVSLGYPRNWNVERGVEPYLRQILPHRDESFPRPGRR
jgi:3',5'-cyclic AMP phosphodiesterase CpdA